MAAVVWLGLAYAALVAAAVVGFGCWMRRDLQTQRREWERVLQEQRDTYESR